MNATTKRRSRNTSMELRVIVEHEGAPYRWSDQPGIEFWSFNLVVSGTSNRSDEGGAATVATAAIWRVDNNLCSDQVFELDCISYDLGVIACAIDSSEQILSDWRIHEGEDSSYMIADLVLVDKHWRGRRIGPALVFFAANLLKVDAIFLTPAALVTHLDPDGRVDTDYFVPRPGPEAKDKVRKAWRRAGFTKLVDGVVWRGAPYDNGEGARAVLARLEHDASEPSARVWWFRRIRRAARNKARA